MSGLITGAEGRVQEWVLVIIPVQALDDAPVKSLYSLPHSLKHQPAGLWEV